MAATLKTAVIGCGSMGFSVVRDLLQCEGVSGVVGVDPDPARRAKAGALPRVETGEDAAVLWDDPDVRLVFICSPNHTHAGLALAALRANKAVMLEKPVASTLSAAEEVARAAEQPGAFLQVGFECRYCRLYEMVKEAIDAGAIGRPVNFHCNYICSEFHHKGSWRNRYRTGGGMFGEKLCHYVDLPRWWSGSEIVEIHSVCAPNVVPYFEVRDNYHCVFRLADGAVGHLTFMMYVAETFAGDPLRNMVDQQTDDGHELRYLVVGTRGAIETDVFRRRFRRWEFSDSEKCLTSRMVQAETWESAEDHRYFHDTTTQTRDIVRRVVEGRPPRTGAADALQTMRVVEAAEHSATLGRAVRIEELTQLGDYFPAPANGSENQ